MICSKCSREIPEGSQFCSQCGSPIKKSDLPTENPLDFLTKTRSVTKTKKQSQTLVTILLVIIFACAYWLISGGFLETKSNVTQFLSTGDRDFTIRVTGNNGLRFKGGYMVLSNNGSSYSKSVEGVTPSSYNVLGKIISTTFQKQNAAGSLRVEILRGGSIIKESTTTSSYGVVSVATD